MVNRPQGQPVKSIKVKIVNRLGLHARPASLFVKKAAALPCKITVKKGDMAADAKSILAVLTLGVEYGDEIELICEGENSEEACKELVELINQLPSLENA